MPNLVSGSAAIVSTKSRMFPLFILGTLFFIFGFVTWLSSVLIPYLQIACELTVTQSYFVAFAFYISYFVMAIPSAWLLRIIGFKRGMTFGLLFMAVGALVFVPAALYRHYGIFLLGLFFQGAGLTLLQTASNPYVTIIGPIESAAKRMCMMGVCNIVAGIIAPAILGAVILNNADAITAQLSGLSAMDRVPILDSLAQKVIFPYLAIAGLLTLLALFIYYSSLPEIDEETLNDDGQPPSSLDMEEKSSIFQYSHLLLGVAALFLYTGVEVVAANSIIGYGTEINIPLSTAKFFTSFTLFGMLVGFLLGILLIPKYLSQRTGLTISATLGVLFGLCAIFTSGVVSVVFVALLGLANSLIGAAIWPLALRGLGRHTKTGSALLVMAISGGALLPLLYGWLSEHWDAQQAYWIIIPCYLIIGWYAIYGYKAGLLNKGAIGQ